MLLDNLSNEELDSQEDRHMEEECQIFDDVDDELLKKDAFED